jgi:hypothetical protein
MKAYAQAVLGSVALPPHLTLSAIKETFVALKKTQAFRKTKGNEKILLHTTSSLSE